jgi:short-subunit dehydrogenase
MGVNIMDNQVVVITGASAGVGRAVARAFAKNRARIGLIARDRQRLEAAATEVERAGGKAVIAPADVADADQVESAAEVIERALGPIDIWVNNAMTTIFSPFLKITPEEFKRATEVTYLGTVNGTRSALKRMRPRNKGKIVQVGSALAYRSVPIQAPYSGAKFAIRGFTDAVRTELLHEGSGVHLTMVHLPAVNTPQFTWCRAHLPRRPRPVAPVYRPEVAARAIVWASRNRRRELFVGIPSSVITLANKLFPWAMDHYLARTAIEGQQTGEPIQPDRRDNLFTPVPGEYAAEGEFANEAYSQSIQLEASIHRKWIALGIGGLALLAFCLKSRK